MVAVGDFLSDRYAGIFTQPANLAGTTGTYSFQVGDPANPSGPRQTVFATYDRVQTGPFGYQSGWRINRVVSSGTPQEQHELTQTYGGQAVLQALQGYSQPIIQSELVAAGVTIGTGLPPLPHPQASDLSLGPNLGGSDAVQYPWEGVPSGEPTAQNGLAGVVVIGGIILLLVLFAKRN